MTRKPTISYPSKAKSLSLKEESGAEPLVRHASPKMVKNAMKHVMTVHDSALRKLAA